uniref:Uncharacterized protein n=1 Tax=Globodera rostochiensis TaxID=31243 RepID=A0A914HZV5_GLORO
MFLLGPQFSTNCPQGVHPKVSSNYCSLKLSSPIGQCGPLENSENAFLRIISSLLSSHDASEGTFGMAANATTRQSGGGRRGSKTAGEH